jgi:hypothetical protein
MARTKGHRRKAGTLRIGIYIILIIALISIIVLADAKSEEMDYDANFIKFGAAGMIGLILFVDMYILSKPRGGPSAPAPDRVSRPAPGPKPAARRPSKPVKKTPPRSQQKKKKAPRPRPGKAAVEEEVVVEEEYDSLEQPEPKPSRYAAELKDLQETKAPRERKIHSYPPDVRGGKYGDCFLLIDKYTVLKIRTLLAKAEELPVEEEIEGYNEYDEYAGEDYAAEGEYSEEEGYDEYVEGDDSGTTEGEYSEEEGYDEYAEGDTDGAEVEYSDEEDYEEEEE